MIRINTFRLQRKDHSFYLLEYVHQPTVSIREQIDIVISKLNSKLSIGERCNNPYTSGILFIKSYYYDEKQALIGIKDVPTKIHEGVKKKTQA